MGICLSGPQVRIQRPKKGTWVTANVSVLNIRCVRTDHQKKGICHPSQEGDQADAAEGGLPRRPMGSWGSSRARIRSSVLGPGCGPPLGACGHERFTHGEIRATAQGRPAADGSGFHTVDVVGPHAQMSLQMAVAGASTVHPLLSRVLKVETDTGSEYVTLTADGYFGKKSLYGSRSSRDQPVTLRPEG